MFRNGTPAPPFQLPDDQNQPRTLTELNSRGPLVLLFFRGAFCETARRDLLAWSDIEERLKWTGAGLAALSVDPPGELARLRETLGVRFPLLSDTDFLVSRTYGVYESDETDEGPQPHGEPATFVLDAAGNFVFSQIQSGPKGAANPNEVLLMLMWMQRNDGRYW